jgi:hypothetical protein
MHRKQRIKIHDWNWTLWTHSFPYATCLSIGSLFLRMQFENLSGLKRISPQVCKTHLASSFPTRLRSYRYVNLIFDIINWRMFDMHCVLLSRSDVISRWLVFVCWRIFSYFSYKTVGGSWNGLGTSEYCLTQQPVAALVVWRSNYNRIESS